MYITKKGLAVIIGWAVSQSLEFILPHIYQNTCVVDLCKVVHMIWINCYVRTENKTYIMRYIKRKAINTTHIYFI